MGKIQKQKGNTQNTKCEETEDVEYFEYEDSEYEVSTTLRNWRSALLNRRLELMKKECARKKLRNH